MAGQAAALSRQFILWGAAASGDRFVAS